MIHFITIICLLVFQVLLVYYITPFIYPLSGTLRWISSISIGICLPAILCLFCSYIFGIVYPSLILFILIIIFFILFIKNNKKLINIRTIPLTSSLIKVEGISDKLKEYKNYSCVFG